MNQFYNYNPYFHISWQNYYYEQAQNAWLSYIASLPTYQPLYTNSTWQITDNDKWNIALASCVPNTMVTEDINKSFDWAEETINKQREKDNTKAAEKEMKKAMKKRERNRVRNERKKQARREANELHTVYFEKYGKRFYGRPFGSGWARERYNKNEIV